MQLALEGWLGCCHAAAATRQLRRGTVCTFRHRLVLEGHTCMLFGCVDAAQHFHTIGYGICDSEDTVSHAKVFLDLKTEVEAIVAKRIETQQPI